MEDSDIEKLIIDKVDIFWKAIEGGSSRSGQVCVLLFYFESLSIQSAAVLDDCYIFRETIKENMVLGC